MSFENRERIVSDMFFYFKRLVYYFVKSTKNPKDFKLLYSFTVSSGHKVIWGVTYLHFSCLFCITLDSEMQDDFFSMLLFVFGIVKNKKQKAEPTERPLHDVFQKKNNHLWREGRIVGYFWFVFLSASLFCFSWVYSKK